MPKPPPQKGIEHNSLPLPATWAATIELKDYWERKDELEQLEACEPDPLDQDWLPGYDAHDRYQ